MAKVTQIWRFPIKSVRGESLTSAPVGQNGLAFDRGWSILDLASGNNLTARRTPELLMASARVVDDDVVITLPDGTETSGADPSTDSVLSAWLGIDVSLVRATADAGGTYENPMDFENDSDWVSWTGPGGAFHDSTRTRISIVSVATLGDWDLGRFRTNLIIDGVGARAEDAWVDSSITVGSAELNVTKQIDRCVMVTRPQPGIGRDLDVLRKINSDHNRFLGIGTLVKAEGTINVGDTLMGSSLKSS